LLPVRSPRRHALTLLAAVTAAVAGIALFPGGAAAEPRPTVQQVQRQVAELRHEAEQATERYNHTRVQMDEVRRTLGQATKRLDRAKADVTGLQTVMGRMAAASYKSGGMDMAMQLLLADDPEAFLQQATALDQLSRQQAVDLRKITAARQELAQERLQVDQQREQLAALQTSLKTEKDSIEARIADAESLLGTLKAAERARLETARLEAAADARAQRVNAPRASRAARTGSSTPTTRTSGSTYTGSASGRAAIAVRTAYAQLGDPYRWGGTGPDSFDCSGLTAFAWRAAGVSLPHSSSAQYSSGRHVSRSELSPGDLVFFYSPISHVGIYIGGGRMIDAPYPGLSVHITSISSMPYSGAVRP